ncbi:MAG TPA: hypothetical protein VF462_12145 [Micromonosporaceae bacterium]
MNVTENGSITVDVVRGEMQPWSDYEGHRKPTGGAVLQALLQDVLPQAARALVVGPHARDVIELVAASSESVTVLLRSVGDATTLEAAVQATNVKVVTGALDGFADRADERFDVVVAADGLDRVLGTDSPAMTWPERASALARTAAPQAVVVLGCDNEFALTGLLDRRPVDNRHGDDEWRPLHDDPYRPTSPDQLVNALAGVGLAVEGLYAMVDVAGVPHTMLDRAAAAATRPGRLAARLAVRALEASTVSTPLLAPVADSADAAARAGLLDAVSPCWLAVCGATARTVYAEAADAASVLTANLDEQGWRVRVSSAESAESGEIAESGASAGIAFSPAAVPGVVPDTESVERVLLRLAAAEDVPGFRRVAAQIGEWARGRTEEDADVVICFDDLCVDGESFARGVFGWVTTPPASTSELLAAAWQRFQDRLLRGHRRHPWPPWMVGDELVTAWLAMCGEEAGDEATAATVKRGREIADAVAAASGSDSGGDPEADLRTALADAEAARVRAEELAGHIFGLERTIRFRDQQLRVRESRLRGLRSDLRTIQGSRAAKLAEIIRKAGTVRQPRRFARGVKRRLVRVLRR